MPQFHAPGSKEMEGSLIRTRTHFHLVFMDLSIFSFTKIKQNSENLIPVVRFQKENHFEVGSKEG